MFEAALLAALIVVQILSIYMPMPSTQAGFKGRLSSVITFKQCLYRKTSHSLKGIHSTHNKEQKRVSKMKSGKSHPPLTPNLEP